MLFKDTLKSSIESDFRSRRKFYFHDFYRRSCPCRCNLASDIMRRWIFPDRLIGPSEEGRSRFPGKQLREADAQSDAEFIQHDSASMHLAPFNPRNHGTTDACPLRYLL
jgi:hypothetical protein